MGRRPACLPSIGSLGPYPPSPLYQAPWHFVTKKAGSLEGSSRSLKGGQRSFGLCTTSCYLQVTPLDVVFSHLPRFQDLAHPFSLSYSAYRNLPPLLALRKCTILWGSPEIMLSISSNAIASHQKVRWSLCLRVIMTPVLNALNYCLMHIFLALFFYSCCNSCWWSLEMWCPLSGKLTPGHSSGMCDYAYGERIKTDGPCVTLGSPS